MNLALKEFEKNHRINEDEHGFGTKLKNHFWGLKFGLSHGIPGKVFHLGGGLGDQLLGSSILFEWAKRGYKNLWFISNSQEFFNYNPHVKRVVPDNWRVWKFIRFFQIEPKMLDYGMTIGDNDRVNPLKTHIIEDLCYRSGLKGEVSLRPYLFLSKSEKEDGKFFYNQIAIQNTGMNAANPMKNKDWYVERYQKVVDSLKGEFSFVQIGSKDDPKVDGATDCRGLTSFRRVASILHNSRIFVGQVGFLMHLARAVDCPSVIIYGGKEAPHESGYICNDNLYIPLECSPCWQANFCDYNRACMDQISVEHVIHAIRKKYNSNRENLTTQTVYI